MQNNGGNLQVAFFKWLLRLINFTAVEIFKFRQRRMMLGSAKHTVNYMFLLGKMAFLGQSTVTLSQMISSNVQCSESLVF